MVWHWVARGNIQPKQAIQCFVLQMIVGLSGDMTTISCVFTYMLDLKLYY